MVLFLLGAYALPFSITCVGATRFRGSSVGFFGRIQQREIALGVFLPAYTGAVRVRIANDNAARCVDV